MSRLVRIAAPIALLVVLGLVWEAACDLLQVPVYLLPAPSRILAAGQANLPLLAVSA